MWTGIRGCQRAAVLSFFSTCFSPGCIPYCRGSFRLVRHHGSISSNELRKQWLSTTFVVGRRLFAILSMASEVTARGHFQQGSILDVLPREPSFSYRCVDGDGRTEARRAVIDLQPTFRPCRASLTVYVVHFVPFALFHASDEIHQWSSYSTAALVVYNCLGIGWDMDASASTILHARGVCGGSNLRLDGDGTATTPVFTERRE